MAIIDEYAIGIGERPVAMSWEEYMAKEEEYLNKLMEQSNKATIENPIGFLMTFPEGDGQALYLVRRVNPLTLTWVAIGDNWYVPPAHERGLVLEDVHNQIGFRDAWNKVTKEDE